MTPALWIMLLLVGAIVWILFVVNYNRRKDDKEKRQIEQDPFRYLDQSFAFNSGSWAGYTFKFLRQKDAQLEKSTRPPDPFEGYCFCPDCGKYDVHNMPGYGQRYVIRECTNRKCQKIWRQIR